MGEKIGEGNFGIVFGCIDGWNNDLAAKVLKPNGSYERVRSAAEGEFQKLVLLRHPNITYIYDAFEWRDTFYIVTERCYSPVETLFTAVDKFDGKVWLMPIARCLLQAVHYVHQNGFVHQDIHPGNVFASFAKNEMDPSSFGSMQFKLGDLGIAKAFGEVHANNTRAVWMAPPETLNVAEYGPVDHRVDIYHLGLLFLQLAYSRLMKFSPDEILAGKPREMAVSLPQPLGSALEKALRRHSAFRTSSAMEFWRDLNGPPQVGQRA
jgi:serine/threonine-protein kinase